MHRFDEQILESIGEENAWRLTGQPKIYILKPRSAPLKSAGNSAQAEKHREERNRQKIGDSWGSEFLSIFDNASRSQLIQVAKVVKKFPV